MRLSLHFSSGGARDVALGPGGKAPRPPR